MTSSTRLYNKNCIGAFHFGFVVRLINGVFNVNEPTVISQYGSREPFEKKKEIYFNIQKKKLILTMSFTCHS